MIEEQICANCQKSVTDCECAQRRAEVNQRKVMLEKRVHHTVATPLEDMVKRDDVAKQNRDALARLALRYNLYISQRDYDKWRPTVETTGTIAGLYHLGDLTCIATDGLQAFFVNTNGGIFQGHVQHFEWDVPVVSMVPYRKEDGEIGWFKSVKDHGAPAALFRKEPKPREAKQAKPKLSLAEKALKVLQKALKGHENGD